MGGRQYIKGALFENLVKKHLEDQGLLVTRSAKSHGPWDLMVWDGLNRECMLIQCKTNGKISKPDRAYLRQLAEENHCIAMLAYKTKIRGAKCEMERLNV